MTVKIGKDSYVIDGAVYTILPIQGSFTEYGMYGMYVNSKLIKSKSGIEGYNELSTELKNFSLRSSPLVVLNDEDGEFMTTGKEVEECLNLEEK